MSAYARYALLPSNGSSQSRRKQKSSRQRSTASSRTSSRAEAQSSNRAALAPRAKQNHISFRDMAIHQEVAVHHPANKENRPPAEFEPLSQLTENSNSTTSFKNLHEEQQQNFHREKMIQHMEMRQQNQPLFREPLQLNQLNLSQASASATDQSTENESFPSLPLAQSSVSASVASRSCSTSTSRRSAGGETSAFLHQPSSQGFLSDDKAYRDKFATSKSHNSQGSSSQSFASASMNEASEILMQPPTQPYAPKNMQGGEVDQEHFNNNMLQPQMHHEGTPNQAQATAQFQHQDHRDGPENEKPPTQPEQASHMRNLPHQRQPMMQPGNPVLGTSRPRSLSGSVCSTGLWGIRRESGSSSASVRSLKKEPSNRAAKLSKKMAETPRRIKSMVDSALRMAFAEKMKEVQEREEHLAKQAQDLDAKVQESSRKLHAQAQEGSRKIEVKAQEEARKLDAKLEDSAKQHSERVEYLDSKSMELIRAAKEAEDTYQKTTRFRDTTVDMIRTARDNLIRDALPVLKTKVSAMLETMGNTLCLPKVPTSMLMNSSNNEAKLEADNAASIGTTKTFQGRTGRPKKKAKLEATPELSPSKSEMGTSSTSLPVPAVDPFPQRPQKRGNRSPLRELVNQKKPRRSKRLKMTMSGKPQEGRQNPQGELLQKTPPKATTVSTTKGTGDRRISEKTVTPASIHSNNRPETPKNSSAIDLASPSTTSFASCSTTGTGSSFSDPSMKILFKGPLSAPTLITRTPKQSSLVTPACSAKKKVLTSKGSKKRKTYGGKKKRLPDDSFDFIFF